MSEELYYTSAPRGLKPGSRDYCTVARTPSLTTTLADQMESLSGYRILFTPHDPDVARNPVAWSHVRIAVAGRSISVLSRICASGLDYTGRTNKFAHHVAIDDAERPDGGPAWLLSQPGFMVPAWDGQVRPLPGSRTLPQGDFAPRPATAWQSFTGDPGWAGVVAEAFLADPRRLVYLVVKPGADLLPLFAEAQALLPIEVRWNVGFNTYYTGLPPGVSCPWRGITVDSPEAEEALRIPQTLILDLTRPLGQAQGGILVSQARTGVRVPPRVPVTPPPPPPTSSALVKPEKNPTERREHTSKSTHQVERARANRAQAPIAYDLTPAGPPPIPSPSSAPLSRRQLQDSPRSKSIAPLIAVCLSLSLLFVGVAIFVVSSALTPKPQPDTAVATLPVSSAPKVSFRPPEPPSPEPPTPQPTEVVPPKPPEPTPAPKPAEIAGPQVPERPEIRFEALPIPLTSGEKNTESVILGKIPGKGSALTLLGLKFADESKNIFQISDKMPRPEQQITIIYKPRSVTASAESYAQFDLVGREIRFKWDKVTESSKVYANLLRNCVLEVRDESNKHYWIILCGKHVLDMEPLTPGTPRIIKWQNDFLPEHPIKLGGCRLVTKNPFAKDRPQISYNSKREAKAEAFIIPLPAEPDLSVKLNIRLKQSKAGTTPVDLEKSRFNEVETVFDSFGKERDPATKEKNLASQQAEKEKELSDEMTSFKEKSKDGTMTNEETELHNTTVDRLNKEIKRIAVERTSVNAQRQKGIFLESIKRDYRIIVPVLMEVEGHEFEIARIGEADVKTKTSPIVGNHAP